MRPFDRFKKFIACALLAAFIPSQAWAQGITIPSGSSLNVATGTLTVPGFITNAGTLSATTGAINLSGNWTNSGTFSAGTSTVAFNAASGTQTLNSGGTSSTTDAFYNLTHNAAGTAQLTSNAVTINNNFTNSSGTFNANSLNMTVTNNWNNTATFTPGTDLVTLNGTNQTVSGTTSFYQFAKSVTSAATLTFDHTGTQTFTNSLTLGGASGQLLSIRSDLTGTQANIALSAGGLQTLNYLDVEDSNASGGLLLVPNNSHDSGDNTNWDFGVTTLTWKGGTSTDWNTASNWDAGFVPRSTDTVVIANASNQPVLATAVTVAKLTINSGSTLTLNGYNLTVTSGAGTFNNNGTLILDGNETVTLTMDSTHGTFEYVGVGSGSSITHTLIINGSSNVAFNNLTIDDASPAPSHRDIFALNGTVTINGNLTVTSGTLNADNNSTSIAVTGAVSIATNGILDAPQGTAATAFTVGGNWANNGTFNNDSGAVTFTTTATSVITGNTTFYDLLSTASGKTIQFPAGGNQTVSNIFSMSGVRGSLISLVSTVTHTSWSITLSGGAQTVGELNVQDSNALTNTVTCLNCTNSGNNNSNWIFTTLSITSPANGTTVGQAPTMIGLASASATVYIRDKSGNLVATTKSDASGNFRVAVGNDGAATGLTITPSLETGSNSLTPYVTSTATSPGLVNNVTVTSTPTTAQVPDITKLNSNTIINVNTTQIISGSTPTIAGDGAPGQTVTVQSLDSSGNLVLTAGSGTVASDGTYSVTLTTGLPAGTNYLSVTVGTSSNETTSALIKVSLTDPFGYVYNSTTNEVIKGATVTLFDATTKQAATGVQSCNAAGVCSSANPFTTLADGFYGFLAPAGQYYLVVASPGYTYPSVQTTVPSGRTIGTGSKGETFSIASTVFELDQPLDANVLLLRIVKTANKPEVSVGDIVTYTVNIQNLSSTNAVTNVYLSDLIPPGFKYIQDRVLLGGVPITNPSGQRPVVFNIGTVAAAATVVLQYQLVIGSGVTMGAYRNTAQAQYSNGMVISNLAQTSVRIVPNPIFDLGTVIGKVFFDWDESGVQKPPYYDPVSHQTIIDKPVPNVQIVMEDGTIITTDRDGKFNMRGLLPGRHLFRLDERTLPPGAYLTTDKAVIVDVTPGSIAKVNFGVNIDTASLSGSDAVFFNEKIRLTQDRNRPVPRLNAALFDSSADAKPGTEEVLLNEGTLVRQAEFRIFTNYSPFIDSWRLEIMDADTQKSIRQFEGTPLNINDPIYWNGQDDHDVIINGGHKYSYIVSVTDNKGNSDETKEKPIFVREIKDAQGLKKEREETKDVLKDRADRYRKWLEAQAAVNNLYRQLIPVQGETIHLDRQGTDVKSIRVMKAHSLFTDIPLVEQYGLTPSELMAGGFSTQNEKDNLEIILPNGDYSLDVVSGKASSSVIASEAKQSFNSEEIASSPSAPRNDTTSADIANSSSSVIARGEAPKQSPGTLEHYSRPLKVGDDYLLFVALGDAKIGYNIDRGNISPIQDSSQLPGFYHQNKGAFYLKGQILGKYLITSSYDSDRAQKALFRQLDPNTYYPVYGDESSINYDATNTQGALYLAVQWDKSQAIWGNYAVDFNDTEFSAFSRSYYGGKIDYQSVSSNPYGDARTKIVVYHAQTQQLPSHNEFLATGGSLYFLKYRNVVEGSDTVIIQVRDQTTGLVKASQKMTNGADYELDNSQGRILFWLPVAMLVKTENIISNSLISGDPIYVVVDYQYAVAGLQMQDNQGARVAQAIGNNVVLGGTYIQDNANGQNYSLQGTDVTLHVNKDATVKAEYAQTQSQENGSFVSTDGGITFSSLALDNSVSGKAYGIKGDARLFDSIGVKSYYKWIGADFGATSAASQQGKEMMGMSLVFDMTPVTRLTASEDIQKLINGGNLQTSAQVGASETDTTMVQIVHNSQRLKLTGAFQLTEVKSTVNGITSTTNQRGATIAGQAEYDLTDRVKFTLGQQVDVMNKNNTATTVGVTARVTDTTTLNAQEVFSPLGTAITAGATNQIGKRIALTNNFTLTNLKTGEVDKTAGVGIEDKVNNHITATGALALTSASTGSTTTTASLGAKAKTSDTTSLDMSVGKSQSSTGAQSTTLALNGTAQVDQNTTVTATTQASSNGGVGSNTTTNSVGVQATRKVDNNTSTNASVNMANDTAGGKTTTVAFGSSSQLNQELQAVTNRTFTFSPGNGETENSKYGLVRNYHGQNLEADYTRQSANQPTSVTQSNIYGLSGDVNDKLALNASVERGRVQNLDTSTTTRTDFTVGAGYVLKDTETAEVRLKNSIKLELRLDKGNGTDSLHQYVLYDALDGKITDNLSVNAKLDYSKTVDINTGSKVESHKEIILGMAYRPVDFDNLNFITEYSYQNGYGGGTQQADALNTNVNQVITQVFSAQGIYDINDQWQLAEKVAYRILNEADSGFQFTQTHTWLVIHRLNYKIDRDWTISGELRDLAQVEAKDNKAGLLLEATREINKNTELSIGWNFSKYSDDLTNLSYTSSGPYVRMTGKFYDRSPEEKARDRAKWLDAKINDWAWLMIRKELAKKDSKITLELNRMFALAKKARAAGRLDEARQIYKDIIAAGQMMYTEAFEYIRGRVAFEEKLQQDDKTAREYFRGGEYLKARKIWEKVVEDASKNVVKLPTGVIASSSSGVIASEAKQSF